MAVLLGDVGIELCGEDLLGDVALVQPFDVLLQRLRVLDVLDGRALFFVKKSSERACRRRTPRTRVDRKGAYNILVILIILL